MLSSSRAAAGTVAAPSPLRRFAWLFAVPAALVAAGAAWQTPGAAAVGLGLAAGMALATSI